MQADKKRKVWCFYYLNFQTGTGTITGPDESAVRKMAAAFDAAPGHMTEDRSEFTLQISNVDREG